MKYQEYKKQIIKAKSDEKLLKDMYYYLRDNTTDLSKKQIERLLSLIISFLNMHFNIKKANKRNNKPIKFNRLLEQPINNDYLTYLINNINFKVNNDYIIGLYNLLTDNNYKVNSIGLKIVIAKYLNDLGNINNLKVFKVSNNKLNDAFKFLVFKNNKIKNYTKLYYNNEYNLIIFNTLKHDNIVSVVLYDKTKIKNISDIVLSGVIEYDKTFKHIDNIKDYQYTYNDKEEQYLHNKNKIVELINYRYNTKSVNIKLTYDNIIKSLFNDIYKSDLLYDIYKDIVKFERDNDNFKSNDLELLKTTLNDYDNFNYSNLLKGIKITDIKINTQNDMIYQPNYKLYLTKKMINHTLRYITTPNDIKQHHIEHIVRLLK